MYLALRSTPIGSVFVWPTTLGVFNSCRSLISSRAYRASAYLDSRSDQAPVAQPHRQRVQRDRRFRPMLGLLCPENLSRKWMETSADRYRLVDRE
ncbi:hypothetical protein BD310DRAFT_610836 [Dichomitus squalens]|uniref:Uncharacterized protein n=1 Tax=Dichomitus squalens TaxID=114155 RepID=A0A4Q9PQ96_9APHY|nr:hypothetical protein BD310DRAFT_610836 [Dichomitus squalens]